MNKNLYSNKMENKSIIELEKILDDKARYTELARQAALWEIEKRTKQNVEIDDNKDLELVDSKLKEQYKELDPKIVKDYNLKEKKFWDLDEKLVNDLDAPELYTQQFVYFVSFFFTTIFGSILLYSNLKKIKNTDDGLVVLLIGFSFTLIILGLQVFVNIPIYVTVFIQIIGARVLTEILWNRYIGEKLEYRRKKVIFI